MTPAQADLLRRLIATDRDWRTQATQGNIMHRDDRGVEVNRLIAGVDPRTAQSLVDAGLAEVVNIRGSQNWIFLGKYEPYDSLE